MKRGFEENVPKVRPRVRLGQALDEQVAEAQQVAAGEASRERPPASARLAADLDKRGAELRALRADIELLEAERDGALAQVARLSRELREEKARVAASAEEAQASRAEIGRAREALQ